ncbi:hypothetical protein SAE02_70280 [Skermanella aerolata]|uniref:Uncharacterized protein n=1 Tax=Skermanella aerolata TaxID=393310 RepID=A0A512E329_9PROT|nr:hypothetical protein [Skermanella aerolata]KJB91407.1 hypothetical protein N826_30650 [Skermanella aerolata KACC 11604]GEO42880.1 hypothetical protein SAE02_70280 [Skermanella aerolata]
MALFRQEGIITAGLRQAHPMAVDIGTAAGAWGKHRFVEGARLGLLVQAMAEIDAVGIAKEVLAFESETRPS